ncbi:MAG: bifunctional nicotinamide-nucleotide adenylyltransferase/Nudix hydroxylase [Hyphomicrobiaceae bacterium]
MTYDYLAFIGRFQPFHLGHRHVISAALGKARHVIVLIGSPNVARSVKNPFTYDERAAMLRAVFPSEIAAGRLVVRPVDDYAYNDTAWVMAVQRMVTRAVLDHANGGGTTLHGVNDFRVGLVGYAKDASSGYLKSFPEWDLAEIEAPYGTFAATDIRRDYFRRAPVLPRDTCPPEVVAQLEVFRLTPEFAWLVAEAEWVADYKRSWEAAPYAPTFVTVDCIVEQSGHVLLVRRRDAPGKGLLALPGGFVGADERLRDAAIRELREETSIADQKGPIPPAMLASFIDDRATRVFDAPARSERGRTITHAFLVRCPDRRKLYKVKGGDDAAHAAWYRFADLDPRAFFEDHWFILQSMTGI